MLKYFRSFCVVVLVLVSAGRLLGQQKPQTPRPQSKPTSQQRAASPPQSAMSNEDARLAGQMMQSNGGSLLKATLAAQRDPGQAPLDNVSFFAVAPPDPRVIRKQDLVTIIVRQESEFSSDGKTETKKDAKLDAVLDQFLRFNINNGNLRVDGNAIGAGTSPGVSGSASQEFNGEGKVERSDSFITRIQARVVDVKPNDTIVLEARSELRHDDELQTLILSGTCRAEDITADNSILSTQLFDQKIDRQSKGNVRNANRKGWITKLLDVINPF
jgi:flagellar L-ring protein precursor FlgH